MYRDEWNGKIDNTVAKKVHSFLQTRLSKLNIPDSLVKSRYEYALRGFTARLTPKQVQSLRSDSYVKYVEQDRRYRVMAPANCCLSRTTESVRPIVSTTSSGQLTPWGITRVGGPLDGAGKKAWVISTGIDLNNEDLNVDVANSASFVANESAQDVTGRGTYVAGIIAAKNNSIDVVGVAAGASVVGVKVITDNYDSVDVSNIVDGINYVASKASPNDVTVITRNIHDPNDNVHSIDDAVTNAANAGLRFVIAAGDNSDNASNYSPARVNIANVWTVDSFKKGDIFDFYYDCWYGASSNYGASTVNYSEPGDSIPSLHVGGGWGYSFRSTYGTYFCPDGTPFAAAHLAGLLLAAPHGVAIGGYVSGETNPDPIGVAKTLSVTISGPYEVPPGSYPTWTANPSGGTSPYQYNWQEKIDYRSGGWTGWSNFGNQQSEGQTWESDIYEVELKATVTDANSNQTSATFNSYFDQGSAPATSDTAKTDSTAL